MQMSVNVVSSSVMLSPLYSKFNTTYPQGFTSPPICHTSIIQLDWDNGLKFEINELNVLSSRVETEVNATSTLTKLKLRYFVLDSDLYATVQNSFEYYLFVPPSNSIVQTISVLNHEKYEVIYLKKYQSILLPNYESTHELPTVTLVQYLTPSQNSIRVVTQSGSGFAIISLNLMMFNITSRTQITYPDTYSKYYFSASNTNNTLQTQFSIDKATYPNTYFYGLHVIHKTLQLTGGCSIDIENWSYSNAHAYVAVALFLIMKCPLSNPYLSITDQQCYDICPQGQYPVEISKQCHPCPSPCFGCDPVNPTVCTSCNAPNVLGKDNDGLATCVCQTGFYGNPTDGCFACAIPNCLDCQQPTTCTKCDFSLVWLSGSCECAAGTRLIVNGSIRCVTVTAEESCSNGKVSYYKYYCECPVSQYLKSGSCA